MEKVWLIGFTSGYILMALYVLGIFKKKKSNKIKASDIFDAESFKKSWDELYRLYYVCIDTSKIIKSQAETKRIADLEKRILNLEHQPKYKGKVMYDGECYRVLKTELVKDYNLGYYKSLGFNMGYQWESLLHKIQYTLLHNTKDIQVTAFESELKPWKK